MSGTHDMRALDPPSAYPNRRWVCLTCGKEGRLKAIMASACVSSLESNARRIHRAITEKESPDA